MTVSWVRSQVGSSGVTSHRAICDWPGQMELGRQGQTGFLFRVEQYLLFPCSEEKKGFHSISFRSLCLLVRSWSLFLFVATILHKVHILQVRNICRIVVHSDQGDLL